MADQAIHLTTSDGVLIRGAAKTATFTTGWYDISGYDRFGLLYTADWTDGTVTPEVQMSIDGGTTAIDFYPDDANSQTQASMSAISADGSSMKMWDNFLSAGRPGTAGRQMGAPEVIPRIRFNFTFAGVSTFTFSECLLIGKKY